MASEASGRAPSLGLPSGRLSLQRVAVMGILGDATDAFTAGLDRERAVERALAMVEEGADIIQVGGGQGKSGDAVGRDEEKRLLAVLEGIRRQSAAPLSVDAVGAETARAALESGADIVTCDAGCDDVHMLRTLATMQAAVVLSGGPEQLPLVGHDPRQDPVEEAARSLREQVDLCLAEGVHQDHIVLDPGLGRTAEADLELIRALDRFTSGRYPVLLAASRPSLDELLGLEEADQMDGSLAVITWAVLHGVKIVKAREVRAAKRVCRMTEAVLDPTLVEAAQ